MSKLYNKEFKVETIPIDPLGSRLDKVGVGGALGRMNRLKLRKTKKIIQKTPDKKFKTEKTPGKEQKKLALREQKSIADKMTQKGDPYTPPIKAFKKGGGFNKCGRKSASGSKRKYPKCVPAAKAASMTESQRRSAVARKRSKAQGVGGKPTNVATFAKRKKMGFGGMV